MKNRYAYSCTWPPVLALLIILGLSMLLTGRYKILPVWGVAVVITAAVLFSALAFMAEHRKRPREARVAITLLVALISVVVIVLLANLLVLLITGGSDIRGLPLLSSGVQVWVSNVLAFGLWFWLLDRGGPHARMSGSAGRSEFLFPEMTAGDAADPRWSPSLIEYMFLSFTNCTAFSPTDTLPLSSRVRLLMTAQSVMSLVTIALVTARAVNILA